MPGSSKTPALPRFQPLGQIPPAQFRYEEEQDGRLRATADALGHVVAAGAPPSGMRGHRPASLWGRCLTKHLPFLRSRTSSFTIT